MSCTVGDRSCEIPRRRLGLLMLAIMTLVFLTLSVFSFVKSHDQATPDQFTHNGYTADEGKRVFQSYNCMDCHTIVGNGAYFAPDLTDIYSTTGAAWLAAFIPSANAWPTQGAVKINLAAQSPEFDSVEDYFAEFAGAKERVERRGGQSTHMPNLPFREGEVDKLIAFFKYTSALNTRGWPPKILSGSLDERLEHLYGSQTAVAAPVPEQSAADDQAEGNLAAKGEGLVTDYACLSCHATDSSRKVGPGWGGLYQRDTLLTDGSTVVADADYIKRAILEPNAEVVDGYSPVMPSYAGQLDDDEIEAIVAYIVSLADEE